MVCSHTRLGPTSNQACHNPQPPTTISSPKKSPDPPCSTMATEETTRGKNAVAADATAQGRISPPKVDRDGPDPNDAVDATVRALVDGMTLEEKIATLSGGSMWTTRGIERLGLPSLRLSDGPQGVRKTVTENTSMRALPATCFPAACALSCSWDAPLVRRVGRALSRECRDQGVHVLLGPGMNVKRHPRGGRNFEYFSEDPVVSGRLAAAAIGGIQGDGGTAACAKHVCANNQESWRFRVNAIVDDRALRELYLRGFEQAVRAARPATVMCAYNQLNGIYCSEQRWIFQDVLRGEWGFGGLVMTDWGATNRRVVGINAGIDLEMPGTCGLHDREIRRSLKSGALSQQKFHEAVCRNVRLIHTLATADAVKPNDLEQSQDTNNDLYGQHHELAYKTALECIVLLQNDSRVLPLTSRNVNPLATSTSVALVGDFCIEPRYQGMGSSRVTSTRVDTVLEHIEAHTEDFTFSRGYSAHDDSENPSDLIEQAVEAAGKAAVVVIFAGVPEINESEGFDRENIDLPLHHNQLIDRICDVHDKVVVALSNGGPVAMPWKNKVQAIIEGYLLGQAGARAMVDILFGVACPSGKLTETFPISLQDVPSDPYFPGDSHTVEYREGLNVGYRYYDTAKVPVLFPFGHGLSYTEFQYSEASCHVQSDPNSKVVARIHCTITNTGTVSGKEIVQIYIHHNLDHSKVYHPEQELREFAKTRLLQPGESETLTFGLTAEAFVTYDVGVPGWILEEGVDFEIRIGSSSRDIRCTSAITSDDLVKCGIETAKPSIFAIQSYPPIRADGKDGMIAFTPVTHPLLVDDASFANMLGRDPRELMTRSAQSLLGLPSFDSTTLSESLDRGLTVEEKSLIPHDIGVIHRNSFLGEIELSGLIGRMFCSFVYREMEGQLEDSNCQRQRKIMNEISRNLPLRALAAFSSGMLSFEMVDSLIALFNGQYCSATSQIGYVAYSAVASIFVRR
jgi:beta-glucosidase